MSDSSHPARVTLRAHHRQSLLGTVHVPGDKSITHRSILFGLLATGETTVRGWLDAADCRSSIRVARQLGASIDISGDTLRIIGTGGILAEPDDVLDCGNSGTTIRLFLGPLTARVPYACLTGDASLRQRPMGRVIEPLRAMGAVVHARSGGFAPLAVKGQDLTGTTYDLPVASAQVKSALILAGLLAKDGNTTIIERLRSRDHTENMLPNFGVSLQIQSMSDGSREITIPAGQTLHGTHVHVPADPSSAAFIWAAAAIVPGSSVTTEFVSINPTRVGFLQVLRRMGGRVDIHNVRDIGGEQVGDVSVSYSELKPTVISGGEIPTLIDELPIIAVLAACAKGETIVSGAADLRVKESDRISAIVAGLNAIGVSVTEATDGFRIHGTSRFSGGAVESHDDHRIAMSFAVAGLRADEGVHVHGANCIDISFPQFMDVMNGLGANFQQS